MYYNDYGHWIRGIFPFRVQKIAIDAGFRCAAGGCGRGAHEDQLHIHDLRQRQGCQDGCRHVHREQGGADVQWWHGGG